MPAAGARVEELPFSTLMWADAVGFLSDQDREETCDIIAGAGPVSSGVVPLWAIGAGFGFGFGDGYNYGNGNSHGMGYGFPVGDSSGAGEG
jgi:hypothetical protein